MLYCRAKPQYIAPSMFAAICGPVSSVAENQNTVEQGSTS